MRLVTHIPSDDYQHQFCSGCWNYWFFCDCVNNYLEDGELIESNENDGEDDDDDEDEMDPDPFVDQPSRPRPPAITPSPPKKKPKPINPDTPGNDGDDTNDWMNHWPDEIKDDGNPDTIQGNQGKIPPNWQQVPVVIPPVVIDSYKPKFVNGNQDLDINDFIKDGKFTYNLPGSRPEQDSYVLDPRAFYELDNDAPVWSGGDVEKDGVIDPWFEDWFDFYFAPAIKDAVEPYSQYGAGVYTGQTNVPGGIGYSTQIICFVDPNGKEWYSWYDWKKVQRTSDAPPSWAQFFNPESFQNYYNPNSRSLAVDPFRRLGDPRRGRRTFPFPPLIFPDSYVDIPINRRGTSASFEPQLNNPSNNPGLTGTGIFQDAYRGLNVDRWNISKFVIPSNASITNGRSSFRNVNGNFGNTDTYLRKEVGLIESFYILNELKRTDLTSYAIVEFGFSTIVQVTTVTYGPNISPEIIEFPVTNLANKVTIRPRGGAAVFNAQTVNVLIPPGDFKYFDTDSIDGILPFIQLRTGVNTVPFDWVYLRHFKKSTSAHIEFGPQAGVPGQQIIPVPTELPSTVVKNQDTFLTNNLFSTYPQFNRFDIVGTKFNWTTRVQGIWKLPINFEVNLFNSVVSKLALNANGPVGVWQYGIIPIGQQNGIATNATDGIYEKKSGVGEIYDYRLHVNFYTGLWITTD